MTTDDYSEVIPAVDPDADMALAGLLGKRDLIVTTIEMLEDQLARARKALAEIEEEHLPAALDSMNAYGASVGPLRVKIKSKVYCTLPVNDLARRAACLAWLAVHGHGDMVKDRIQVHFPRGQEGVDFVEHYLRLSFEDAEVTRDSWVEPQTLLALARKIHKAGGAMPEAFGFFARRTCEVVPVEQVRGSAAAPADGQNDGR